MKTAGDSHRAFRRSSVVLSVSALTALGATLRFATLDRQSFWLDELVTVSLLHRSFGDMLAAIPGSEATPYLYYVLAWPWARLAGFGEVGLRSLSALVGAAIVPVAYGAGTALVSRRAGLMAAALVGVHPFLVWYAQEARAYSLFALLAACTVLFFGRALRTGGSWDHLGWAVSAALAIATHYFAVFLVLPEALWLLTRSGTRRLAALAALLPTAVGLAHVPLLLEQRGAGNAVSGASLGARVAGVPKGLAVGYSFPAEIVGSLAAAALIVTGLVLLVTRASPEERRHALVPGGLALAAIGAPIALALAGADYVIVRNTILAILPAAICIAAGYAASRGGLAVGAALCILLLAITLSVSLDARYGRTDWRGVAKRLDSPSVSRAIVVTPFLGRQLWEPYLPGLEDPSEDVVRVQEIAAVGLATEEGFSISGPVEPPSLDSGPPPPPTGFRIVADEREVTFTLILYRATSPRRVSLVELDRLRLADRQAGFLLQRRSSG